jgi:uncharacterized protein YegP (UPF0339 family)
MDRTASVELYKTRGGRHNWRLVASNGEKLSRGSQARGFSSASEAWKNFLRTAGEILSTKGDLLDVKTPRKGSDFTVADRLRVVRKD